MQHILVALWHRKNHYAKPTRGSEIRVVDRPGRQVLCNDLNNIEARVLAWLADEQDYYKRLLSMRMYTVSLPLKYLVER